MLARYSRSNEGLAAILGKVDVANPDASIDRILKFVDYGHASIGGLTGGLAVALDGVSMWLAYKMFEIAQMADGQESSTRYIAMEPPTSRPPRSSESPPTWRRAGATCCRAAFAAYHAEYARLDALAAAEPRAGALSRPERSRRWSARMRKNYALDRARYFIPFATRTNLGLVQTSRMWAQTVKQLDSLPQPEARAAARLIRDELLKQSPRLMRHSFAETSYEEQARQELAASLALGPRAPVAPSRSRRGLGAASTGRRRPGCRGAAASPRRSATGPTATASRAAPPAACGSPLPGTTWRSPSCATSTGTGRATGTRR